VLSLAQIKELVIFARQRAIDYFEVSQPNFALKIEFLSEEGSSWQSESVSRSAWEVRADCFGYLVTSAPASGRVLAPLGSSVAKGDVLALLQIGALYRPVRAPVAGTVAAIFASAGDLVEFGSKVFEIEQER